MGHVWVEVLFEGDRDKRLVRTFVDTGSTHILLPYRLADELGVRRTGLREESELVDGKVREFEVTFVRVQVLDRKCVAKAYLTDFKEPALGALTLEDLGLEVDTVSGEVRPSRSWRTRARTL